MKNLTIILIFIIFLTFFFSLSVNGQNLFVDDDILIEVCFTGNHTCVSDLGFYLIAPGMIGTHPGFNGVVQLLPSVVDWGPEGTHGSWGGVPWSVLGCNASDENTPCNNGNDFIDLCFTSTLEGGNPNYTACICDMETPLTGEFAPVDSWENIYGYPLVGDWVISIFDCMSNDIGGLFEGTISFSNGLGDEVNYSFYPDNDYLIFDNCCNMIYAARWGINISPESILGITIYYPDTYSTQDYFSSCEFIDDDLPFEPYVNIDSIAILSIVQSNEFDYAVTYQVLQEDLTKSGVFTALYYIEEPLPQYMNINLSVLWENTSTGSSQIVNVNHEVNSDDIVFTEISELNKISNEITYPNPVSDLLKFKDLPENTIVSIYDQNGRILVKDFLLEYNEINVEQYESGIYTIKIEQNGDVKFSKFVKK
ncbi:MAG: T9SS type A sorting domain-containing protein [Bacteroidales bacterium]|nr:T9SS type A sorting domain-containing protein [Bacteroidales bacterium]